MSVRIDYDEWWFTLYPAAGEGGGCRAGRGPREDATEQGWGWSEAEGRAQIEADRRARAKIRRYCAANRLNRLGTLTYAGEGCSDPRQLRGDVAAFFRELRSGIGEGPLPYLWVPQWHPGGHGLHAHFAVGRYVPRRLIERAWGRGFVHIKLLGGLPTGSGTLTEARVAARYLAGYVGRETDDQERPPGLHRYEVAQGFQPVGETFRGYSAAAAITRACERMGSAPEQVWRSEGKEDWHGPPACWAQWA